MTSPHFRRRMLLRIALLLAMGKRRRAYAEIGLAINSSRLTHRQSAELFLHLSPLLGVPTALEALAHLRRLSHREHLPESDPSSDAGLRTFRRIYGSQTNAVLRSLRHVDRSLPGWIIDDVYGSIFSRKGLSLADREAVTFSVLALQGFDPQCRSHLRGALRLGVPGSEIIAHLNLVTKLSGRSTSRFKPFVLLGRTG